MDRQRLIDNIVGVAKAGRAFGRPIVHSTVNVKTGLNKPAIPHLRKVLGDLPTIDRTSINAWEDVGFVQAVKATGRKKLIMTALWMEACLTFPALTLGEQDLRESGGRVSGPVGAAARLGTPGSTLDSKINISKNHFKTA